MLDKVTKINVYHAELFAERVAKLKATADGDTNLLDSSLVVYGGGLADGNNHTHDRLPTLVFGRGGGAQRPGRHLIFQRETPITNLFTTMVQTVGVEPNFIGDSTGALGGLT
jgi:hypothetical protein